MLMNVKINTKEDVERLSRIASEQPFDMGVHTNVVMLDAKSLLALYTLIGQKVAIVAPDGLNPNYFAKLVKKMKLEEV